MDYKIEHGFVLKIFFIIYNGWRETASFVRVNINTSVWSTQRILTDNRCNRQRAWLVSPPVKRAASFNGIDVGLNRVDAYNKCKPTFGNPTVIFFVFFYQSKTISAERYE